MSTENGVPFKVFLMKAGQEPEVRRFAVEKDAVASFAYLSQKLCTVFPSLKTSGLKIFWKDLEGDNVQICNDEELLIALSELEGVTKKIYVVPEQKTPRGCPFVIRAEVPEDLGIHFGVTCDACNSPVIGYRYKCAICADYDLCADCEQKQMHKEHLMIRIPVTAASVPKFGHKFEKLRRKLVKMDRMFKPYDREGDSEREGSCRPERGHRGHEHDHHGPEHRHRGHEHGHHGPEHGHPGHHGHPGTHGKDRRHGHPKMGKACPIPEWIKEFIPQQHTDDVLKLVQDITKNFKIQDPKTVDLTSSDSDSEPSNVNKGASTSNSPVNPTAPAAQAPMETEEGWSILNKQSKVDESLEKMLSMGFNNDGGWLKEMLVSTDGDIGKVVDKLMSNKFT